MKKYFFSIIIPSLNEEKYLGNLLTSLKRQTYRDFETILVDGKSEDRTVEIFNKYASGLKDSKVILSDKRNVSHQRNIGARKALGKYLIFLDADVTFEDHYLEKIRNTLLEKKYALVTTWINADSKQSIDRSIVLLGNIGVELSKAMGRPFAGGYNTIIKKNEFERIGGFREDLHISEDQELSLRAQDFGIELAILKDPQINFSLRRFRSEGTIQVLRKYAQVQVYSLLKGPITKEIFDYPMGGNAHKTRKKKKINLKSLSKYIQAVKRLEKKITDIIN